MKLTIKILSLVAVLLIVVVLLLVLLRDAAYYCRRAAAEMAKDDVRAALADYDRAIKLKPDYVDAYIGRGRAKYKHDDLEGALADYNKANEFKPDLNQIPDMARSPEAIVTNEIAKQALTLLETKNYGKLDDLAAKFRSSKECYADGVWKLASVYDGLVPANRASDAEWGNRITGIEDWALARPVSITARVALANVLVAYAWKARGAGEINTVSKEGWQLFGQRLVESMKFLKEANTLKEKCPQYWRVLMRDALGLQLKRTDFDNLFNQAIKAEPNCESFYVARAIYLLPQWYGALGEWGSDLAVLSDKVGGENGDMLYAQVVWNMDQRYDMAFFGYDNLSWPRVDKGFEIIQKHFPEALEAKIEQVHLAVIAKNAQAAVYYNSGIIKEDKGDLAGAIADYTKAVEKPNPDDFRAYNNRGNVKRTQGDTKGALADFNHAIEINPGYAFAYYGRGTVEQDKGDYNNALADFSKAIELKPDFVNAYRARGNIRQYKGDKTGASSDLNKANELSGSRK